MTPAEAVNHPPHYTAGGIECIDVLEQLDLPFHLANAIKYLWRHNRKGAPLQDLRKARWYIDRYIALIEKRDAAALNAPDGGFLPLDSDGGK